MLCYPMDKEDLEHVTILIFLNVHTKLMIMKQFLDASQKGHVNVVKLLLKDTRVDPAANNNAAIRYASQKG